MKNKIIKVKSHEVATRINEEALFGYRLQNQKQRGLFTILDFQKDDSHHYDMELEKLEKEYFKRKILPFLPSLILFACTITLFTLFICFYLNNKDEMLVWFLSFLVPGIIFALGLGIYSYIRAKQTLNYVNNYSSRFNEYKKKAEDIKNGKQDN